MQFVNPVLLSFSLLTFAAVSAYADDANNKSSSGSSASPSMSQSNTPSSSGSSSTGGTSSSAGASSSRSDEFDKIDTNHDGQISRAEWDAHQKKEHGASGATSSGSMGGGT